MKSEKHLLSLAMVILTVQSLCAQSQLYLIPQLGFFSGSYRGIKAINGTQNFLESPPFLGKDFKGAIEMELAKNRFAIGLGFGSATYASGFAHREPRNIFPNVQSFESISQGDLRLYYAQFYYDLFGWDIPLPGGWQRDQAEKKYFLLSRIRTMLGVELRRLGSSFIQDYPEHSEFSTTMYGSVPGSNHFHSYGRHHISLRAGLQWMFYNQGKRKFYATILYHFAFNNAGHFLYHFSKPASGIDFYYQNATRGNGFTILLGVPLRIAGIGVHNK